MRRSSINAELTASKVSASSVEKSSGPEGNPSETSNNGDTIPELTPESASALVQPFFPKVWSEVSPKDVTLKTLA